jgi:DNA mismatch endonuclease (patch repair protein)
MKRKDFLSVKKRSQLMSRIPGKGTGIEKSFENELRKRKLRFTTHYSFGAGTSSIDFAFPKSKVAVFVDGDFWHGHDFSRWKNKLPTFWRKKIETNIRRDILKTKALRKEGWKVLRFWEHELKRDVSSCASTVQKLIH